MSGGFFGFISHDQDAPIELVPDVLNPGDRLPGIYSPKRPCMAVRDSYEQFPARCARVQGHEGNHASGAMKVHEAWWEQ
ncbi:MAG TPA: hypothetical protein VJ782_02240 [Aeromicrobium sp.]|nr:hypothetical protein [Aeromicrobium sp.]